MEEWDASPVPDDATPTENAQIQQAVERHERRTLAGSYLVRAIRELRAAGSPDDLYPEYGGRRKLTPIGGAIGRRLAKGRQREATRSAVLFAMLAAEAYVNQYLQIHLTRDEFEAADRLPTFEKFILGPRLVGGSEILGRGEEPAQTLKKLLNQRSQLVHPKLAPPGSDGPEYTPLEAAEFIVAAGEAAGWLLANSDPRPQTDMTMIVVDQEREYFLEFARRVTDRLPEATDPSPPDLVQEIWTKWADQQQEEEKAKQADAPQ
jgi:hypothetical protein